jgi:hypothetical protein
MQNPDFLSEAPANRQKCHFTDEHPLRLWTMTGSAPSFPFTSKHTQLQRCNYFLNNPEVPGNGGGPKQGTEGFVFFRTLQKIQDFWQGICLTIFECSVASFLRMPAGL